MDVETAFSTADDEVVADAVCISIPSNRRIPPGSFVRHFAKRVAMDTPFSPRLRQVGIAAIERMWRNELKASGFETARLLNHFDIDCG